MGDDDENTPPQEDTRSVLDRLETRNRPYLRRTKTAGQTRRKHPLAASRIVASDPDTNLPDYTLPIAEEDEPTQSLSEAPQHTDADADGDDEDDRASSDHHTTPRNVQNSERENKRPKTGYESSDDEGFFRTPMAVLPKSAARTPAITASPSESSFQSKHQMSPTRRNTKPKPIHSRNMSTSTVLFSPTKGSSDLASSPERRPKTSTRSGTATPGRLDALVITGARTPKRGTGSSGGAPSRPRAIMPPRDIGRQIPNMANFLSTNHRQREPSFNAVALDLASDLGDNNLNPNFGNINTLPASFTTQFEIAARMKAHGIKGSDTDSDSNRMSRIMLARMTTLEEGFRDMIKEVKTLKQGDSQAGGSRGTQTPPNELSRRKGKGKKKSSRRDSGEERMGSSL